MEDTNFKSIPDIHMLQCSRLHGEHIGLDCSFVSTFFFGKGQEFWKEDDEIDG